MSRVHHGESLQKYNDPCIPGDSGCMHIYPLAKIAVLLSGEHDRARYMTGNYNNMFFFHNVTYMYIVFPNKCVMFVI